MAEIKGKYLRPREHSSQERRVADGGFPPPSQPLGSQAESRLCPALGSNPTAGRRRRPVIEKNVNANLFFFLSLLL